MSRKSKQNKRKGFYGQNYWQSADYNRRLFLAFQTQIINLALSRFKWLNLPSTCDERFLEFTLLTQGVATIAKPKKGKHKNHFYSTQAIIQNYPNVYDNPTKWDSFGNNNWRFSVTPENGVLVWENLPRMPLLDLLDIYARELTDVMRTKQLNRQHQKIPFLITGPQTKYLDMVNLYKMVDGGEPAVIATEDYSTINVNALKTEVTYLGNELQEEMLNIWQNVYTLLGISSMPFKAERQIRDEIITATEPSAMMSLSPLTARRYACEKLNARFGNILDAPIQVIWRKDNLSDNFNLLNNLVERAKSETGDL